MDFDQQLTHSSRQEGFTPALRVREAHVDDVEQGLVRIGSLLLRQMDWQAGDVVRVEAARQTLSCVYPLREEDEVLGRIQMDGLTRENAQVGLEERVRLCRCQVPPAETLLLLPLQRITLGPQEVARLRQWLHGRALSVGDKVCAPLFFRQSTPLRVSGFAPEGQGCRVVMETDVRIQEASRSPTAQLPPVRYEDLGGLGGELGRMREMVELPLKHPQLFSRLRLDPPKGVLLYGPPGTGKTTIARAVANEVKAHFIRINGPEVIHKFYGESEARLREIFDEAQRRAPSIIFIDEIDAIAPKRADVAGEVEKRVVGQLLALMDGMAARGEVVVIGATNLPELLDHALRRPGRFDREIVIRAPDRLGRLEILRIHARGTPLAADVSLPRLAELTHGFVGADLEALCREAGLCALQRTLARDELAECSPQQLAEATQLCLADFQEALRHIEPTATREFFVERPNVSWEAIGGLQQVKQQLVALVELPRRYPQLHRRSGLASRGGILLAGAPGCGKTLLVHALATRSGLNFINVDAAALFSKWVGESERALRQVFIKAKQAAPCILFFDGLERLFPAGGPAAQVGQERLTGQFLAEMDRLAAFSEVLVLGAAQRVGDVDAALLNPGRFGMVLQIGALSAAEREEVLHIHAARFPLAQGVDFAALARQAEGLNGAALEAICTRAAAACIQQHLEAWGDQAEARAGQFCISQAALCQACAALRQEQPYTEALPHAP